MANEAPQPATFSARGRWAIAFHVSLGVVAALALVLMANYLAARHPWRFQLALHRRVELSPQTTRVLHALTNDVKITVFFNTREEEELYSLVTGLLREYHIANSKLAIHTVDPARQPGEAGLVLSRYKLTALRDRNFVVLDCNGRTKLIPQSALAESKYEPEPGASDRPPKFHRRLLGFNGEAELTAALFNLANPRQFRVGFTRGHGEHDPDASLTEELGYSRFAQALTAEVNAQVEKLDLRGTNEIPADCQLLIIAGPRLPFNETELAKVEGFLKQGGRLLALLSNPVRGPRSGLETVLAKWNVAVGDGVILDPGQSSAEKTLLTSGLNTQHPVTKALLADSADMRIMLVLPRAVARLRPGPAAPDAPQVDYLATTSEGGLERGDIRDGVPYPNPFQDRQGTFPLIVAVEQGGVKDVSAARGATRLVVVGDSFCLDNQLFDASPANHYFGTLAANWLLDRPQVTVEGIVPRPLTEYRLTMTRQELQTAQVLLLGVAPGSVLLLGVLVWWRRRH